ncbi:hypothetical protein N7E81_15260 [Reichenbachiella carrageenanivorans]|uniref:WD40-like Beta Propeller Repeat n=1 Tax=Reichenbachiella carrageenanivorans TaxID=2979869 RepID=A0ABY6CXR8_9BACT|nr:hypothetical protein [Reichenbachiella carrageenanivorans]UXX78717.1 hypothetical protein N7E81_15260 [Reichenbachiella carrageenanivorans]
MKIFSLILLLCLSVNVSAQSPVLFMPDTISTRYKERDMTISLDGNHLLYSIHNYQDDQRMIVEMKKTGKEWGQPKLVAFSGQYKDIEPMFTPDGSRLYFASDRPLFEGDQSMDYNIWYVDRTRKGWSIPVVLDSMINTDGDEFYPSVSNAGTLYFTATRPEGIGKEDIFYSLSQNGVFSKPIALGSAINTVTYEFNAFVDPDENYLLFSSYKRPDGLGSGDLYIAYRVHGQWQLAVNLGSEINSPDLDYCPFVSADGETLYFTSNRKIAHSISSVQELREWMDRPQNGFDDIYCVPMNTIIK